MYFTETPSLREIEKAMKMVPNFTPRGHGVVILCKHEFAEKNCIGTPQKEILARTVSRINNPLFQKRFQKYINESETIPVNFRNSKHSINSSAGDRAEDGYVPEAFRRVTRLSQHIAYLKDFFRSYKDFTDSQIDTIEILLAKLYARFGITDSTDYSKMKPTDYPIMEDLYKLCEEEFMTYDKQRKYLYTEETLQEVCLGIHSMCVGTESKYFNGHSNITDDEFLCFGVKGLMDTNRRLKDAMLFNILSHMSNQLLGKGNTAAAIDELYLYLTNRTAIEYIRNAMKRVRKKDSAILIASQNINDFLMPEVCELTKPLFAIPTHQFMLSFISMHKEGWQKNNYAACCGVSDQVLWQMMKDTPNISKVYLCLDNDEAGQSAAKRISDKLFIKGIKHEILVPIHKDWNEDLLYPVEESEAEEPCQMLQL